MVINAGLYCCLRQSKSGDTILIFCRGQLESAELSPKMSIVSPDFAPMVQVPYRIRISFSAPAMRNTSRAREKA